MWAALLLFLCLADVSHVSSYSAPLEATFKVGETANISACPITYLGKTSTQIRVNYNSAGITLYYQNGELGNSPDSVFMDYAAAVAEFKVVIYDGINQKPQFEQLFPNRVFENGTCVILVNMYDSSGNPFFSIILSAFGAQSFFSLQPLLSFTPFDVSLYYGPLYATEKITPEEGVLVMDTSSCRYGGKLINRSSIINYDPATCETISCSDTYRIITTGCGDGEACISTKCEPTTQKVCSVSGRSIVSFHGTFMNIPDRCTYMLVTNNQGNFKLYAKFQERRRRDVPLLSEVMLMFNGEIFYLKQGRKLEKDGVEHPVGPGVLEMDGVRFSKNQQGVTASLSVSGSNLAVVFDGNTVHVIAQDGARLLGPCGDLTDPGNLMPAIPAEKLSDPGCSDNYRDPDAAVSCADATDYCEALTRPPFTRCHAHLDPGAFAESCVNILCYYPAVDNIRCHLMKAYVTACNLLAPNTLTNWEPSVGCDEPTVDVCQDRHCSQNEFCGLTRGGEARCFCRAIFAANYQFTNTFGGPVICNSTSATISLANCLLEDRRIDYRTLALRDRSCRGSFDNHTHQVTFFYDSQNQCQTEVVENEKYIFYNNSITVDGASQNRVITRQRQIAIDFSCVQFKPEVQTVVFRVRGSSVLQQVVGYWTYTLVMTAYLNEALTLSIGPTTELRLDQPVWVKIAAAGLDNPDLALVLESCWMTPSSDTSLQHYLIIDGCANLLDGTVVVDMNGVGMIDIFSFNMFEFVGHVSDLNLHCQVQICNTLADDCVPNCDGEGSGRARRSTDEDDSIISMQWNIEKPN